MSKTNDAYLVLARKYRPLALEDLRGQEGLVTTLTNAIKSGRLHHAYVLTGIRGTGKTTTARIIAKALNCENGPSASWDADDAQVKAIEAGTHVDVLEFDAASHTGVDDIKELFEGVAYAPVQGRYKVYIIDEVHMLSKQAFNALLKTLEEPPAQVVFIFATTEVNKIPVTVLSRCMRFDLRRIPATTLYDLYTDILGQEKITFDEAAIQLIARAADGSARDGLSLLDQAIALAENNTITTEAVSTMLGLVDRTRVVQLAEKLFAADIAGVIELFDELHELGQDPLHLLTELLEFTHLLTRIKVVPQLAGGLALTELEQQRAKPLADQTDLDALSRVYQGLLTAAQEAKEADQPQEAVLMALVRLTHLASLPPLAELLNDAPAEAAPAKKPEATSKPAAAPVAEATESAQVAEAQTEIKESTTPTNWEQVITLVEQSDPALAGHLAQQVVCLAFTPPSITIMVNKGLVSSQELVKDLQQMLRPHGLHVELAAKPATEVQAETLNQKNEREAADKLAAAAETEEFKKIQAMFPGAKVAEVKSTQGDS